MANTTTGKKDQERTGAGQVATDIKNKVQEGAEAVTQKAKDMASSLGDTADQAASAVGSSMKSVASAIKENAPREGMAGAASTAVSQGIEGAGRYLQEQGLSGAADDLVEVIKRHPIPAVLVGIGIGFLLARVTRS